MFLAPMMLMFSLAFLTPMKSAKHRQTMGSTGKVKISLDSGVASSMTTMTFTLGPLLRSMRRMLKSNACTKQGEIASSGQRSLGRCSSSHSAPNRHVERNKEIWAEIAKLYILVRLVFVCRPGLCKKSSISSSL